MRRAAAIAVAIALAACGRGASEVPAPPVSVELHKASLLRLHGGETLVRCSATLTNTTGKPIVTKTNFTSPFDGLSVVVRRPGGDEIARQSYVYHQSPFSPANEVPLPSGGATRDIVFPIVGLPSDATRVEVRLEGGLFGTSYAGLRSEWRAAAVE